MKSVLNKLRLKINNLTKWVYLWVNGQKSICTKQDLFIHLVGFRGIVTFHSITGIGVNVTYNFDILNTEPVLHTFHTSNYLNNSLTFNYIFTRTIIINWYLDFNQFTLLEFGVIIFLISN